MGLRDKYKKRDDNNGFVPMDLNDANVRKIFNDCLATSKVYDDNIGVILFSKAFGYKENSKALFFDKKKINAYEPTITFLYGQLKAVHDKDNYITPTSALKKYNDEIWTEDNGILMQFLHLGTAVGHIPQFSAEKNHSAHLGFRTPTISPYDPNFTEWYKGYEAKMKRSEGPTPDEK